MSENARRKHLGAGGNVGTTDGSRRRGVVKELLPRVDAVQLFENVHIFT